MIAIFVNQTNIHIRIGFGVHDRKDSIQIGFVGKILNLVGLRYGNISTTMMKLCF